MGITNTRATATIEGMEADHLRNILSDAAAMVYAGVRIGPRTGLNRDRMSKMLAEWMYDRVDELWPDDFSCPHCDR